MAPRSFVAWTLVVHKTAPDRRTACGVKIPSPLKAGAIGYWDSFNTERPDYCKKCRKAASR